jgi:hypothetical protein
MLHRHADAQAPDPLVVTDSCTQARSFEAPAAAQSSVA